MIKLIVKGWSDESAWMGDDRWSHFDYCQRLSHCTYLRGVALNSAARGLLMKQRLELELVSRERAEALVFSLESLGAQCEIRQPRREKVVSLDLFRQAVGERAPARFIAGLR
ncbi:MAG: hypothetical protein G8D61_06430 [gamma proteobacterium symbiont of Ctena orbiculata]|nr:hypothetical protein [Candidatus Thiodiazotropha taylori]MBT3060228.1 hypothetical protein [Candidatus Thiodiazotropha sp. (ex Lucina pensylvanica)]MBT3061674.1 hypothetical protein [Candidatus Thiodiazotropha sp. (ex Lucina pensylvanica)]PUB76062.1 MAG: hypothetical protein DBP03_05815 [gamma proteobacterium symbiont of Ctena orbiculata]PUB78781.1 MAG: hypothetical protein DBO99_06325 [gamma proteobacterium symbiont of Ctena orbiculata]